MSTHEAAGSVGIWTGSYVRSWRMSRFCLVVLLALLWLVPTPVTVAAPARYKWVAGWGSSQIALDSGTALPPDHASDVTVRQVVRLTLGGKRLRVRLSNAHGAEPIRIGRASIGISPSDQSPRVIRSQPVTFDGRPSITIPAGADYVSDPVPLAVAALDHVAVSIHLPQPVSRQTGHPGARTASWIVRGDKTEASAFEPDATVERWFFLAGVDVETAAKGGAIIAFGDSITDGFGVKGGADVRWTDHLAERLQANPATRGLSVVNMGTGGSRVLRNGIGPSALGRFERDVLSVPGAKYLLVLYGVNDLGGLSRANADQAAFDALVADLTGAYRQVIRRAHDAGIRVYGATILPFSGSDYYRPGPQAEAARRAVNRWIRTSGEFDGVIDFDAVLADPVQRDRLRDIYDSGDHLHPSIAAYRVMGDTVSLDFFTGAKPAERRHPLGDHPARRGQARGR